MNPNPYKANEHEPVAESVEEEIAQEQSVWSRLGSLLGFKRDDLVDTNEVTAKEVAPATGHTAWTQLRWRSKRLSTL